MYVCICNAVTESKIEKTVNEGVHSFDELQKQTGVSSSCGICKKQALKVMQAASQKKISCLQGRTG